MNNNMLNLFTEKTNENHRMGKVIVSFEGSTTSKTAVQLSHDKESKKPIKDVPSEDSASRKAAVEQYDEKTNENHRMGKVTVSFEGSTTSKTAVQLSHDKESKKPIKDVPSEDSASRKAAVEQYDEKTNENHRMGKVTVSFEGSTTSKTAVQLSHDKESKKPIKDVPSEDSASRKAAVEQYDEKDRTPIKDVKVSSDDSAGTMAAVDWFTGEDGKPTKDVKVSFEDSAGTMAAVDWFTDRYLYMDCSIDEYVEGDFDNLWTTAATFIVLFLLSVVYGAAVTLVKVKCFLSRLVQYELEREFITVLDQPTS